MARPTNLDKLDAKIEIMMSMLSDLDMEVFELRRELRKKSGPARVTPMRGLIVEHVAS